MTSRRATTLGWRIFFKMAISFFVLSWGDFAVTFPRRRFLENRGIILMATFSPVSRFRASLTLPCMPRPISSITSYWLMSFRPVAVSESMSALCVLLTNQCLRSVTAGARHGHFPRHRREKPIGSGTNKATEYCDCIFMTIYNAYSLTLCICKGCNSGLCA